MIMRMILPFAFSAVFGLAGGSSYLYAENKPLMVKVSADDWCPYSCDAEAPLKGFMYDIVKAALPPESFDVRYTVERWERVKIEVEAGRVDVILGLTPVDVAEGVVDISSFSWDSPTCAYTLSDSTKVVKKNTDLEAFKTIGVIRGYSYGAEVDQYVYGPLAKTGKLEFVASTAPAGLNFKKLSKKRIESTIEDPAVAKMQIKAFGLKNIRNAGCLPDVTTVHIGIGMKSPSYQVIKPALAAGIKRIKESGEYTKILSAYGLADEVGASK